MQQVNTAQPVRLDWHNLNTGNGDTLAQLAQGAQFASFEYRAKRNNELARHTLILGGKYVKQLRKSVDQLTAAIELGTFADLDKLAVELEREGYELDRDGVAALALTAAQEKLASLKKSLEAHSKGEQNSDYRKQGVYSPVRDADGNVLHGLTVHNEDGSLELHGLAHAKLVLEQGNGKRSKPRKLTVAKNHVSRSLPVSRWRTFALEGVTRARVNGDTLELASE
jgi:hypothetical protein